MADKKDTSGEFSTCFEKLPFAEMIQRMMDQQGARSLCAEMMEKVMGQEKDGGSFNCTEMMRKMMKGFSGGQEESEKSK